MEEEFKWNISKIQNRIEENALSYTDTHTNTTYKYYITNIYIRIRFDGPDHFDIAFLAFWPPIDCKIITPFKAEKGSKTFLK